MFQNFHRFGDGTAGTYDRSFGRGRNDREQLSPLDMALCANAAALCRWGGGAVAIRTAWPWGRFRILW